MVVNSFNDGNVYRIARDVQMEDRFWLKNQSYSLIDMLNDSKYVNRFTGGDVVQTFLNGNDYRKHLKNLAMKITGPAQAARVLGQLGPVLAHER